MANQILSSSANFDSSATAGWANNDTLLLSGATLTCDGDTRWAQRGAVLGLTTGSATLGGDLMVDARNTWWLPYTSCSGNVPALGTVGVQNCTGATSGATGEFLGIWTALGTAPLAAGTAIPPDGYIKFRSKVGTFGAETINLPGGATITSTGPGQRGWLNWVSMGNITHVFNRPNTLSWKGSPDQFTLGSTSGADGQVLQSPVADYLPAIEVETAAGSGVYEKWTGAFEGIPQAVRNSFAITGCANNGSGLVRITSAAHGLSTSDVVTVAGIAGATGANGSFTITVISTTVFDLQGSTFGGTYTAATGAFRFTGTTGLTNAIAVTGAAGNGATIPLIRITTPRPHGLSTGNCVKISGVGGTTEANGSFIVTVITTTTFDLQNSIWDATHPYTSGGQMQLSVWNERLVNTPHYNITGIADNGAGNMRVTITAPAPYKVVNLQQTITGIAQTVSGVMNMTAAQLMTSIPGAKSWIRGITGTGAIAALNNTEQIFGWNGSLAILAGTAFGGTYVSGGLASHLNNPYAQGTQFSIASITSGTSSRMRLTLTLPHAIASGDSVTLNGILGSANILALAGKSYVAIYVSDFIIELTGTTFTGGDTFICGMLIDVASLQTVTITGITGTGNISALNGGTYKAVPVDATHFDLLTTIGGTYTSGGVSTNTGDRRGRNYLMGADGSIIFGGPTTGWGLLPPSGCKVRCPNLFVSTATAQAFALNESVQLAVAGATGVRTKFTLNQATVDFSYVVCPTTFMQIAGAYSFAATYVYTCDVFGCSTGIQPFAIAHCATAPTYDFGPALSMSNSPAGGTIANSTFCRNMGIAFPVNTGSVSACNNWSLTDTEFTGGMNGAIAGPTIANCSDYIVQNVAASGLTITSCKNSQIIDLKLCEKTAGIPNGAASQATITIGSSTDMVLDGVATAFGTVSPSTAALLTVNGASSDIRIRNVGTFAVPFDFRNVMSNQVYTGAVFANRIRFNDVWFKNPKSAALNVWNAAATNDTVISDSGSVNGKAQFTSGAFQGWTQQRRRMWTGVLQTFTGGLGSVPTASTTPGNHFWDYIVDGGTLNLLTLIFAEKSATYPSSIAYTIDVGTPKFTGGGSLVMAALNDQITYTWTYAVKGALSFTNLAPVLAGTNTANHTITYDLDKGSGFSGTFQTLSAANLSAETGISTAGVIPRVRIVCNTASATNALTGVGFYATTDLTAIAANPYEYNMLNETFTGLQTGTTINIFKVGGVAQVGDFQSTGSSMVVPTPWSADYSAIARLRLCGYLPIDLSTTITEADQSIPVNQARALTIPLTDPGALSITVTNHGASPVTWNDKQFSITIQDTSGALTASQIVNFIHWNIAQIGYWNGFRALAWPTMVVPNSTGFESTYGTLYGSAGATLKGVRIVGSDGSTAVSGFTRMQANDGTYYTTPTSVTISVGNLISGDRVLVARSSGGAILKDEYTPLAASSGATSLTIVEAIKADTPTSGVIRIKDVRYTYTSYTSGTKTFNGLSPALTTNIVTADEVFVPFIDVQTSGTSETKSFIFVENFTARVYARNGSEAYAIIPFTTSLSVTSSGGSVNISRNPDI